MRTDFDRSEWRRDLKHQLGGPWFEELQREELETAWLRGFQAARLDPTLKRPDIVNRYAADYAERVLGGLTRPGRPGRPGT